MDTVLQRTEKGSPASDGGSEEYILDSVKGSASASAPAGAALRHAENGDGLAIHVTTEYSLESEHGVPGQSSGSLGV